MILSTNLAWGGNRESLAFLVPIAEIDQDFLKNLAAVLSDRLMIKFEIKDPVEIPQEAFNSGRRQYSSLMILKNYAK